MATASTRTKPRTDARPNTDYRLVLAIGELVYHLTRVPCAVEAAERCYLLRKLDGTEYHVSRHDHGCMCTCPDFIFRRDGRDPAGCKHTQALHHFGML